MLHRIPQLRGLPRLALPALSPPQRSLRRAREPDQMSTLQAITAALSLLEGDAVAAPLDRLHTLLVERSKRSGRVY
jgi:DTW domain-containing protein YfiP